MANEITRPLSSEERTELLRALHLEEAGSLAEAAVRVSGILEEAQKTADLYVEEIRQLKLQTQTVCEAMLREAGEKAAAITSQAEAERAALLAKAEKEIEEKKLAFSRRLYAALQKRGLSMDDLT